MLHIRMMRNRIAANILCACSRLGLRLPKRQRTCQGSDRVEQRCEHARSNKAGAAFVVINFVIDILSYYVY